MTTTQVLTNAFNTQQPVETWANKDKEFKILKGIVSRLEALSGDEAAEKGLAMLRLFVMKKRREPDKYWKDAPFTPTAFQVRWDALVAELNKPQVASVDPRTLAQIEAVDIVGSLQDVYGRQYLSALYREMVRVIGRRPRKYLIAMLDELLRAFKPSATRPLPDVAAVIDAERALGSVDTYQPSDTLQITDERDYSEEIAQMFRKLRERLMMEETTGAE